MRQSGKGVVAVVSRLDLVIAAEVPEEFTARRDRYGVATDEQDSPCHAPSISSDEVIRASRIIGCPSSAFPFTAPAGR